MKKRMTVLLILALCLAMAGCCLQHEWQDATCTAPKTCAKCEKTEGEALGHSWQAATCTEAEVCTVCGEKQGQALGHTVQAATCTEAEVCTVCGETLAEALGHSPDGATFQQSGTCVTCGETAGEPLTPAFVEHNVQGQFIELDQEYDYVTTLLRGNNKTTGKLTVVKYETTPSNKEGYEWKKVVTKVAFNDQQVLERGIAVSESSENYYDILGYDESFDYSVSGNRDGAFTVNWNGVDYTECQRKHSQTYARGGGVIVTFTLTHEFLVPVGYDGMVLSYTDLGVEWGEGIYIYDVADENSLHFRLN